MIVHGADELALSMLARLSVDELQAGGANMPRIDICYAKDEMKDAVFPFMAISNDAAIREKITLLGASQENDEETSDLTLFIFTGDSDADTLGTRSRAAASIRAGQCAHGICWMEYSKQRDRHSSLAGGSLSLRCAEYSNPIGTGCCCPFQSRIPHRTHCRG